MQTNTQNTSSTGAGSTGTAQAKAASGTRLKLQQMLAGVQAAIPDGSSLIVPGGSLSKAEIVKRLTDGSSEYEAVDAGVAALGQVRFTLGADIPGLKGFLAELKNALKAQFGSRSPMLAQFGLSPQKVRKQLTPEQRVARAEKARQTRLLRHTGGVQQKAAVKYQGQVVVATQALPAPEAASPTAPTVEASPTVTKPGTPAGTPTGAAG
jgi:hypothetical protein